MIKTLRTPLKLLYSGLSRCLGNAQHHAADSAKDSNRRSALEIPPDGTR
jgi:hypothetical protein